MDHNPTIAGGIAYLAIQYTNHHSIKRQRVRQFFLNIGANLCNACSTVLPIEDFFSDKSRAFGISNICKACSAAKGKARYKSNTDSVLKNRKEYYEKNKDAILRRNASYFERNKDEINKTRKQYVEKNREKITAKKRETKRSRYQTDPVYRLKRNVCRAVHASITRNGYTKRSKTYEILGCTMDEFRLHIERQFTKGMTWEKVGSEIHIDHIVPLASAKTEEDVLALNHHTNLRPCWADENIRKRDSIEFLL